MSFTPVRFWNMTSFSYLDFLTWYWVMESRCQVQILALVWSLKLNEHENQDCVEFKKLIEKMKWYEPLCMGWIQKK